jgi:hypothetical protein
MVFHMKRELHYCRQLRELHSWHKSEKNTHKTKNLNQNNITGARASDARKEIKLEFI